MSRNEKYILFEYVEKNLETNCNSDLSNILGVSSARVSQYRTDNKISVGKILKRLKQSVFRIEPIMELEVIPLKNGQRDVKSLKKELRDRLKKVNGIYVFYDSLGKAIYVGKTKRAGNDHLLGEIKNAWDRQRVYHQQIRVKKGPSFKYESYKLKDASHYISAYEISEEHISIIEALLTRILPNNLTNKRIESL